MIIYLFWVSLQTTCSLFLCRLVNAYWTENEITGKKKGKKQGHCESPGFYQPAGSHLWGTGQPARALLWRWNLEHMWTEMILWWCLEDKEKTARTRKEHQLHEYAACGAVIFNILTQRGMIMETFVVEEEELMYPQVQNCYLINFGLKILCSLFICHLFRGRKHQLQPQASRHTVTICCSIPHSSCQFWHCETPWKQLSYQFHCLVSP